MIDASVLSFNQAAYQQQSCQLSMEKQSNFPLSPTKIYPLKDEISKGILCHWVAVLGGSQIQSGSATNTPSKQPQRAGVCAFAIYLYIECDITRTVRVDNHLAACYLLFARNMAGATPTPFHLFILPTEH